MANANIKSKPDKYVPSHVRSYLNGTREIQLNFEEASKTNIESTSSFRYEPPLAGLKSSQQLNVDFSKFENHTFFNSAEANVNVAFDTIINNYPFDGTRKEIEAFFDKLTGFEKWVYDQFPKNKGFLLLSGTQVGQNGISGTYIAVNDFAGGLYPELSKTKSGNNILDPANKSFSIEIQLFLPTITNDKQVICQKISQDSGAPTRRDGFSLFLKNGSTTSADLVFGVASGSFSIAVSASLDKGKFNHICAVFNRNRAYNKAQLFINESLAAESNSNFNFEDFGIAASQFLIGSGTYITLDDGVHTPLQTLSGALDEFRFFHAIRSTEQQKLYAKKSIFADPDLKLYYKFNEPSGTIGASATDSINRVVLDSSGNSLHALINETGWFSGSIRETGSLENPMIFEKIDLCPVLFPAYVNVINLNALLLSSASLYDQENPNIITKLIPGHYFTEGQLYEGLNEESGTMGNTIGGTSIPGSGEIGTAQVLSSFLFVWAKFFDEMKIFTDTFSRVKYVDYNQSDTTPDTFLLMLAKWHGFNLPSFFSDSTLEQFVGAENIQDVISTNQYSLRYIQNQILRRVLTNLNEFISSKGTVHSIKAFLRAFGINPENSFKIREFGGPTAQQLTYTRETKSEPSTMLSMSLGAYVRSNYLSGSRIETGFPTVVGTMVKKEQYPPHGISNNKNDGLFTSGSWTYEAIYKFPPNIRLSSVTQSLARMHVTSSVRNDDYATVNLVAVSSSVDDSRITAYFGNVIDNNAFSLSFEGINIFDGNKWNVSFGKQGQQELGTLVTSSYFLRAARTIAGEIVETWVTSSYICDVNDIHSISNTFNTSGSYIVFGSQSLNTSASPKFLNDTSLASLESRATICEVQIAQIRFWSKALSTTEFQEHCKNFKSLGVDDPGTNFNFLTSKSGSFQRLRLDVSTHQDTTGTNGAGIIKLFDYSQNNIHMSGTGFPVSTQVINAELFSYSHISPAIDESASNEKVRIRSFKNKNYLPSTPWAGVAPIYRIEPSETPTDDTRFSIEFSVIDALNKDIMNIFATLDTLNDIIGSPEMMFSPDYPDLEHLRNIYFSRLTNKVNLKAFFEFFRWFDTSVGTFIEQLIPRKTNFYGINYVIESHFLERPKIEYYHNKMYLSHDERPQPAEELKIEQISGTVKRY